MTRRFALPLVAGGLAFGLSALAQPDPATAFKLGDADKNGKLSEDEFLKLVARGPKLKDNPALAKALFARLDTDKDGSLSPAEFGKIGDVQKGKKGEVNPKPPAKPAAAADLPTDEQRAFFEKKVRPVLVEHCYKCHAADAEKIKGGLTLDTRDGVRAGGDGGPAVVPGDPANSPLVKAVRYADPATRMPPKGKLPDAVIADVEAWVKMGAPDPRDGSATVVKSVVTPADIEKGRQFWAFQPPKKTAPPAGPGTDIDRFLAAKLSAKGLAPAGPADPRTLIRRLTFDLTGLPPTPEEVETFEQSAIRNPQSAMEAAVDRLLASPAFGERWGRHWLDVARYAETTGRAVNVTYPHAWRYRDYVIATFNADKPFDEFVREQVAGDLLPSTDPKRKAERIVATGFLALGPKALNERNGTQFELDVADEQIDVTTQAFLGLTAACARCHDHKFDPIPQADYYALAGIFRSTETCYGTVRFIQANRPAALIPLAKESGAAAGADPLSAGERRRIEGQIDAIQKTTGGDDDPVRRVLVLSQVGLLRGRLNSYDADGTPKLLAMGVRDRPPAGSRAGRPGFLGFGPPPGMFGGPAGFFSGSTTVMDSPVYARGEVEKPGEVVSRGTLQVVSRSRPTVTAGSGRKELADWLASEDNPLTARVFVNRAWLHLFGRGLVPTPDNFGAAGRPPTYPEFLDHLAVGFMDDGWSVKRLVRRLVLTDAYRRSSRPDPANLEADPDNELVWRMTPRRLDAEALRDAILAVSGRLDRTPPVGSAVARAGDGPVQRPRGGPGLTQAGDDPRDVHRSVYLPVVRDNPPEALALFDGADTSLVVADRPTTTVPAQGLYLLNSSFVLRAADAAADLLLKTSPDTPGRVRLAYLRFYGRPPTETEVAAAEGFLAKYKRAFAPNRPTDAPLGLPAWAAFCQALFASAEFQYRN